MQVPSMQQEAPLLRLGSAVSCGTLYSDAESALFASHCFPYSLELQTYLQRR